MPITVQNVSRRGFLQWSLGIGAALTLPKIASAGLPMSLTEFTPSPATPAAPKPIVTPAAGPLYEHVALISDIHVSGGLLPGSMAKRLDTAVQQVLSLDNPVQKVLVAGDCAHLSGNQADYEHYIRGIQPLADAGL